MSHSMLEYALLKGMLTEEAGKLIVFEITGADGTRLNREQFRAAIELLENKTRSGPDDFGAAW